MNTLVIRMVGNLSEPRCWRVPDSQNTLVGDVSLPLIVYKEYSCVYCDTVRDPDVFTFSVILRQKLLELNYLPY